MKAITSKRIVCYVFVVALTATAANARPRYIDCTDSNECGFGYCCALGMGRFSLPHCLPLGEAKASCAPVSESPSNVTVSYPDGEIVQLTNIHSLRCPCHAGLFCSHKTGTCEDPLEEILLNTID